MTDNLTIGSVVRLKGGGPTMTITAVSRHKDRGLAVWFIPGGFTAEGLPLYGESREMWVYLEAVNVESRP